MASSEAAAAVAQRLQLLAEALAAEFSQSQASATCAAALVRLLPGTEYLSIAVSNPAQGGSIVAASNCAAEGPTTLHLHDPLSSAAGRALALGKPLQTSLLNGAGTAVLPAWTDVQLMVTHAPAVTHLLCIPFGCGEDAASDSRCQHLQQGSGSGALLFGFSAPPQLDARRKAMLGMLVQCLPTPMARLSADTLAFVNFACGSNSQCSCCCSADEEEEEEVGTPRGPCREHDRSDGSSGGAAPSQALRVPCGVPADAGDVDAAGPSSRWWEEPEEGKRSFKAGAAAASTTAAALPAPRRRALSDGPPLLRFSKALLASAEEGGESIMAQHPLTLTFRSVLMEQEYGRWITQYHLKVDLLFSLLLMAALVVVSFVKPFRLMDYSPLSLLLGLGMALPLVLNWLARSVYTAWRERLAVALRLYVVAFINLVAIRSYQAYLPSDRLQQWVTFWMLTGSESLAVSALGFPIRLQLHLPLQFAAMGVASWNIPQMCSNCYPGAESGACFKSSAAMAAMFGFVLPAAALRYIEQRSRALFSNMLRTAATHES